MGDLKWPDAVNDCMKYTPFPHGGGPAGAGSIYIQMPNEIPGDIRGYDWSPGEDAISATGMSLSDLTGGARGAANKIGGYAIKRYLGGKGHKVAEYLGEISEKRTGIDKEELTKAVNRRRGRAKNTHEEWFFNDVEFRAFEFSHELLAHDEQETNDIKHIVEALQIFASPGLSTNGLEFSHFTYPAEWEVSFLTAVAGDEDFEDHLVVNPYLPKLGRCVLKDVNVEYFGEGYALFVNKAPIMVKISLSFQEIHKITSTSFSAEKGAPATVTGTLGQAKTALKSLDVNSIGASVADWAKKGL